MAVVRLGSKLSTDQGVAVKCGCYKIQTGLLYFLTHASCESHPALASLCGGALVAGYLTSATLGLLGLKRRNLLRHGWVLLLMPLHWLLLSLAAWRALWQLLRDPFRWEKTAHGLARTSRLAAQGAAAQPILLRNTSAARPPHPRAAVSG